MLPNLFTLFPMQFRVVLASRAVRLIRRMSFPLLISKYIYFINTFYLIFVLITYEYYLKLCNSI